MSMRIYKSVQYSIKGKSRIGSAKRQEFGKKGKENDGILHFCLKLRGNSTYNEKMKLSYQLDIPPHQITIMISLNCSHFLYKIIFIYISPQNRGESGDTARNISGVKNPTIGN